MAGDTPAMREWAEELVARARVEGSGADREDGLLTAMIRQVLQIRNARPGRPWFGNSRNGSYPKTVTTDIGEVDLRIPRDRNGSFDPHGPETSTTPGWSGRERVVIVCEEHDHGRRPSAPA